MVEAKPNNNGSISSGSSNAPIKLHSVAQSSFVSSNETGVQDFVPERKSRREDEPGMFSEPDLPSDGRDEEGEAMIRKLPQSPELSDVLKPADANDEKS